MKVIQVDTDKCIGCGSCVKDCQVMGITLVDGKAVHKERCIECGHCIAVCPQKANSYLPSEYSMNDVIEYEGDRFKMDPDKLLDFQKGRRSIRQYKPDPVSDEDIEKIVQMGRYTQTGANFQPLRYIVLKPETIKKVRPIAYKALAEMDLTKIDKSLMRVPPEYLAFQGAWQGWKKLFEETGKDWLFNGAPHLLMVVSRKQNEVDGCFNIGHMELMINALGLGACCMGFITFAFQYCSELREIVGIKDDEQLIFSMIFGHPAVEYKRTVSRKPAKLTMV